MRALATALFVLFASAAFAQPSALPRIQAADVTLLGSFTVPTTDGVSDPNLPVEHHRFSYGGWALGMGPDGVSLYFGCHAWYDRLGRISIPTINGVATTVESCTAVPNLTFDMLGGTLSWMNKLVMSAYVYYDASNSATASHYSGASIGTLSGPVKLTGQPPGWLGGYMGVIPSEWRSTIGGPAFTGQCCLSIISRTSYGPSVSVFDPANLVSSKMLLGYDSAHPLAQIGAQSTYFNMTTKVAGIAFPEGTRSLLFIGRQGTGPFCYGTVCPPDPTEPVPGQGPHAYPYRWQVWAYDVNDLVAVKNGTKQSWEVQPYSIWELPGRLDETASITSATYNPATRRIYVSVGGEPSKVVVYQVSGVVSPPPPACVSSPLAVTLDQAPTAANGYARKIVLEGKVCP